MHVLPPDPRLRTPKRRLPRGSVDCHAHIFDRFERYPLAAGRKYSPPPCTREAWLKLHAALGVARVAPYGWHIEINIAKSSDWVGLEPRLKRCPVPLVFDHLGRVRGGEGVNAPGFKVILHLLAGRDDCWTKISSWYRLSDSGAPQCEDMRPLVQAVLRERPDRCVWGTNWPHPGLTDFMPNDADLLDQLESWLPGESVREPLFAANAMRLYRFPFWPNARSAQ